MNNNFKVLIVEDNPMHQKVLKFILKKYFTQNIKIAGNPKEAFPMIREDIPDLIFLDLEMPFMKGDEMLEIMRSMDGYEEIKVIIYSSKVDALTVKRVAKLNIVDFIDKGSDQKVMISKLKKHFEIKQEEAEQSA